MAAVRLRTGEKRENRLPGDNLPGDVADGGARRAAGSAGVEEGPQAISRGGMAQLAEGSRLELPDLVVGQGEVCGQFVQLTWFTAVHPETQPEEFPFVSLERGESPVDVAFQHR